MTKVDIDHATWKSLQAQGAVSLTPPAVIPAGKLRVELGRLADLEPLIGRPIAGQAQATLNSDDRAARLALTVKDASLPGTAAVGKAVLNATITDPNGRPSVEAVLTADGVSAGSAKAVAAKVTAKGPQDAVALTVAANAPSVAGVAAKVNTAGTLNVTDRTLALARMEASWKDQMLRLLAPARFGFADGVAMDRVRLGFQQAELTVAGSAGSKLDLTASLRNLSANVAAIADPSLAADGVIAADARLTGTSARPEGTIRVTADRRAPAPGAGPGAAGREPGGECRRCSGTSARIDTRLTAGPSHLTVTGTAPLSAAAALDLKTDGRIDLAMLDPLLLAQGRRARGTISAECRGDRHHRRAAGQRHAPR